MNFFHAWFFLSILGYIGIGYWFFKSYLKRSNEFDERENEVLVLRKELGDIKNGYKTVMDSPVGNDVPGGTRVD